MSETRSIVGAAGLTISQTIDRFHWTGGVMIILVIIGALIALLLKREGNNGAPVPLVSTVGE